MESFSINGAMSDLQVTSHINGNLSSPEESSIEMNGREVEEDIPTENPMPRYADAFPPLSGGLAHTPVIAPKVYGNQSKPKSKSNPSTQIRSSNCSQVLKIPYEERRYKNLNVMSGQPKLQNDLIRDVMQKTQTQIEVSVTKDDSLTISISGKRDSVDHAKRLVANGLQTLANIEFRVPSEHHGFILGKGGENVQKLELETDTKIKLLKSGEVQISGLKEGIEKAKRHILSISSEQAKRARDIVKVPQICHRFICGPEYENLRQIMDSTGARIRTIEINPNENASDSDADKDGAKSKEAVRALKNKSSASNQQKDAPPTAVNNKSTPATTNESNEPIYYNYIILGEHDQVAAAVSAINKICQIVKEKFKTVNIEVKKHQHKYVIGAKGSGITEILRKTNVSVEIPPDDSDSETITLRGDPEQLGKALTLVYEKASSFDSKEIKAPKWLHRFIIGHKGENIKKITQDFDNKVQIGFSKEGDKITIDGPPTEVQDAFTLLSSSVKQLLTTMAYADIKVDKKWHPRIIGTKGANIQSIKKETGTSITVPSDNDKSDIIRIEGSIDGVNEAKLKILAMAKKLENEKTRDIIIDRKYHKNIIGQKGEKVREVREKFPNVQISFPEAEKKSDIVALRGPKDDVDQCYKVLNDFATNVIASNYRCDVPIVKRFHGNIIGKNGATIKNIKDATGTTISIPAEDSDSTIIVITGRKENCHKARDMILKIQNEMDKIVSKEISIPQKLHTSMIGARGKLIQSIMNECGGVNIKFPSEGENSDKISLRGLPEDVVKAEQQLLKLADELEECSYTVEITAKPEHHRYLIGTKGAKIRQVRENTGARIIFPSARDENSEIITITGKKEAVETAKQELMEKIKQLNNIVEDEVLIDPKHHKVLAAKKAEILRKISNDFGGVIISLPKDFTSNKVALKGAKDCIEGAKKRLLEVVEGIESNIVISCVIPQKHHRFLLAKQGKYIQELRSRFDVQIKFPERPPKDAPVELSEKDDIVIISGKKENVEQVKEELIAMIPVTKEIAIPSSDHKFIVGTGGTEIIKLMNEYDVNILVPKAEGNDDVIKVTGSEKNVDAAINELEKRKEERRLQSFTLTIDVPFKYHSKIVGLGGATIRKMRDEFKVRINVPPVDKNTKMPLHDPPIDEITLIGYEDKCHAAKAAIEEMVKELEAKVSITVEIDHRIHSRLIGQRFKNVRKLMDKFNVDLEFPPSEHKSDIVTITGLPDDCEECKEHLLMLEEEHMDEMRDRLEEQEMMQEYMRPSRQGGPQQGFMVRDAPWNEPQAEYVPDAENNSEFPSLTSNVRGEAQAWGPWGNH